MEFEFCASLQETPLGGVGGGIDRSVRSLGFISKLVVLTMKLSNMSFRVASAGRQICAKTDNLSLSNREVQRSDRRTNDDNS
jgi:hypothetical protein